MQIDLADGQMPLNNRGDEIELINVAGDTVHFESDTGGQAASGNVISIVP